MTLNFVRILSLLLCLAGPVCAESPPKPVKLLTVDGASGDTVRQFFGQVVARQTVDLAFQVGGQIVKFPVIEGEPVAKGDLIAQLDLETFQLALDQARLEKEQADRNVSRLEKLSGNTVSQVSIDDAITQAGLAAIAVRNAERALEDATLLAPFDGLVAARNVANFTTTSPGSPVVRLHDMSELRIEIDVPEILFQRAGQDPNVDTYATFPTGDERFPLEVREFNAEASTVGQTFRITFGMPQPEGLNILPGSSVRVTATLREENQMLVIPASALALLSDGSVNVMVFEAGADDLGTVTPRPVEVSVLPDGRFEVLSGLAAGDVIVAAGASALSDGQTVRRFSGFPK